MVIMLDNVKQYENGSTATSKVHVKDENGDVIGADIQNTEHQVWFRVKRSDDGEIMTLDHPDADSDGYIRMEVFLDPGTTSEETVYYVEEEEEYPFYLGRWEIPDSVEEGEYLFVHKAEVGGSPVKKTETFEVVDVAS